MGNRKASIIMRNSTLLCVLALALAVEHAESVGRRSGGAALDGQLTLAGGSNTAGNDEEDDDLELGEATCNDGSLLTENRDLKLEVNELKHKNSELRRGPSVTTKEGGGAIVHELGSGGEAEHELQLGDAMDTQAKGVVKAATKATTDANKASKHLVAASKVQCLQQVNMKAHDMQYKVRYELDYLKGKGPFAKAVKKYKEACKKDDHASMDKCKAECMEHLKSGDIWTVTRASASDKWAGGGNGWAAAEHGHPAMCDGGATLVVLRQGWGPIVDPAYDVTGNEACSLLSTDKKGKLLATKKAFLKKHVGERVEVAVKKLEKQKLDVAKVIKELRENPKMFYGMKAMCCDKHACGIRKKCNHLKAPPCMSL